MAANASELLQQVHKKVYDEQFLILYANNSLPPFQNMSTIIMEDPQNFVLTMKVQIIFYMIYSIIFLLGICGNFLVVYAVLHNRAMQNVTNFFILNLALSDILLCVLCVPFTPLYTFLNRWVFGNVLCHLVPCAQAISIYISSLTLTAIAIDRFVVIIYPFRARMLTSTCLALILCTWLFSTGATLPYGVYVEYKMTTDGDYVCEENFPDDLRLTFGTITTVLQFVVPFLIMTVTYTLISLKLSSRVRSKPGSKSVRKEQADRERKRRTNRMLIAMVAVFGLSWLPLNLMNILEDVSINLGLGWENWPYFHLLFFVAHAIAMSSTCYNPFLYAWLNENFRKEFKEILPCFRAAIAGGSGTARGTFGTGHTRNGIGRNGGTSEPRTNGVSLQPSPAGRPEGGHAGAAGPPVPLTSIQVKYEAGNDSVLLLTSDRTSDARHVSTLTAETATDASPLVTDL
ncbi:Neuropeptide Y receptor type 2 [Amphibalanus amphitrite]|uniref:Neuropeptide Y receptor type 2 n=1 Tax=Amphibalanus amphitrite TaxID=1232801 RepID=A0A6A4WDK0_AMPAM|nr:prolactin-releasing peptide receptor-like [Amphibalanus amphitrite]KAF0300041.1 Neuropeptide Y receptor type 2 [Amphibalanus amphitrite]